MHERYFALLESLKPGLYPRKGGRLVFVEFTAIHPIGTFNDYAEYRGRKIPLYPTPGRRASPGAPAWGLTALLVLGLGVRRRRGGPRR